MPLYLDDVWYEQHNPWCGELLAIQAFSETHEMRKIAPFTNLRGKRLFRNARWIDQMYMAHVLDHLARQPGVGSFTRRSGRRVPSLVSFPATALHAMSA
jgi:hypothetical protein